jgi:AcrR family transcriptional regulator
MPTPTFWNLPPAKRAAFITAAVDEFADHEYAAASVGRIAARAGVAKGSVYQYFVDKRDLFLFLLDHANQTRLDWVTQQAAATDPSDFWTRLRSQARLSAEAALAFPQLTRLFLRTMTAALPFRDAALERIRAMSRDHWRHVVAEARTRGDLRSDVDSELVALLLDAAFGALGTLLAQRLGMTHDVVADLDLTTFGSPDVDRVCDQMILLLQTGLQAPKDER